jgi:hypothetical protein
MEQKMEHVCDWPGCTERTERWFTDGWTVGSDCAELLPGLPDDCLLCQRHALALDALEVGEQPPTTGIS